MKKTIPSVDYHSHCIHPYTAKLIPHIPHHFIKKYTRKHELIFDPFCGSGTTLLEAKLWDRNAVGIDINPLAVLISKVKTKPLNMNELRSAILLVKKSVKNRRGRIMVKFPNIDYWFCRKAQNDLSRIKFGVENLKGKFNSGIYGFLLVCFSSTIRKSSYADPRIAKIYKSKRVIKKIKAGWMPTPIRYFEEALDRNFERLKSFSGYLTSNNNCVKVFQGDARESSSILKRHRIKKVDFIITSPPYINAQDYFRSYKLELWWLGLATFEEVRFLRRQTIGTENISGGNYDLTLRSKIRPLDTILNKITKMDKKKSCIIYNYFENMERIFKESYNVLKMSGYFCLITGNNTICEVQIPTYKILTAIAENVGFKLTEIGRDSIKNHSLPPNRNHNGGIIKEEWITVFQKRKV